MMAASATAMTGLGSILSVGKDGNGAVILLRIF
jgi:hypothetical protein